MGIVSSSLRQCFFLPAPTLTEKNLPSQSGKVFIVTGSNTGVGYQLASILYGASATVYVAARTPSKANSAIESIKAAHPNATGAIHFLQLDLSDLSTIKKSADEFLSREKRLDVLWNNAGVMIPGPNQVGAQGYELTYATNLLGPFLFTKLLLPLLQRTAQQAPKDSVRVCWAGSLAVDMSSPQGGVQFGEDGNLKVTGEGGGWDEYGTAKAGNYLLAGEFGRRESADGVLHNNFNPGNLKSDLQRTVKQQHGGIATWILHLMLFPPVMGAYTELYAGLSPDLTIAKNQGCNVWPWGRVGPVRKDVETEVKEGGKSQLLYEWCERETGKFT